MKMIYLVSALAVASLLFGCEPISPLSTESEPESSSDSNAPADPKKAFREAAAAELAKQSAAQARVQYVASIEAQLQKMDEQIVELTRKAESLAGDAKTQLNDALASLKEKRSEADERLEEVRKASAEAWHGVKAGFEALMKDLERTFHNAESKYS